MTGIAPALGMLIEVVFGRLAERQSASISESAGLPVGLLGGQRVNAIGKLSARLVGLNILSTVRDHLGSLDKVKRLVKTLGMVNCTTDFQEQPQVINGFSELMAQVFGDDAGVGARSAVGTNALPVNIPVEIECIFEVA